ncbi:MAG: hypothetical protein QNL46_03580 [Saprospiraceae bacterium]
MKLITLILAIMIIMPPVMNTAGYLFGDDMIMLDASYGEEEQEERESKDAEEKDIEFDLDEKGNSNAIFLQTTTLNAYIESTLQSQNHTKDISPPPKV